MMSEPLYRANMPFTAASIGSIAWDLLRTATEARLLSTTSRGLFLLTNTGRVLFLTTQRLRGPLTITLAPGARLPANLVPGAQVQLGAGRVRLPGRMEVSVPPSAVWMPPPPPSPAEPAARRQAALTRLMNALAQARPPEQWGTMLSACLAAAGIETPAPMPASAVGTMQAMGRALRQADEAAVAEALWPLLGLGRGLTPSGDDFAAGLLLALNRWPPRAWPQAKLAALNEPVLGAAFERTTALSASLIECATQGLADEGLVRAVDAVFAADITVAQFVEPLLTWGASSGLDFLAGAAMAATFGPE